MRKKRGKNRPPWAKNWDVVIGLTGGVGSGKSLVLSLLKRKKRILTVDADRLVRQILSRDRTVLRRIRRTFGAAVFRKRGRLDKSKLAEIVFASAAHRRRLEAIIHPRVHRILTQTLSRNKGFAAVCDVPLLFERGWAPRFDHVVVVSASRSTRIKRLEKRGLPRAQCVARMKAQWPLARKARSADFVINNNGTRRSTKTQVDDLWSWILQHTKGSN